MATGTICDVFRHAPADGVKEYRIIVVTTGEPKIPAIDLKADLCPRAVDRLKKKIEAGTKPPVRRKAGE